MLAHLEHRLDLAESRPPTAAGEPNRLILRPCRDTYPPDVAIRVKVEAYGQLPSRKVTVTVHGRVFGLPPKATGTLPAPKPGRPAKVILPVDVSRRKLDAGQEYTARAKCGGLSDEAVFVVDRVAPTVQTNKPVCAMGDCIGITVEDPAVRAGGAGVEAAAGTAGGQRLAAESPLKQIDCRLEEAAHSPGTFYGRVRCIDARAGGPAQDAAPCAGRCGAGAVGAEVDDIPCGPNQLIRFHYERGNEEAWTAVLVEEPDAGVPGSASSAGVARRPACAGIDGERGGDGAGPVTPRGRMRGSSKGGRGQ